MLVNWLSASAGPPSAQGPIRRNWSNRLKTGPALQASGKSDNVNLWYLPRFELLQNRMDNKDPEPSSIGVLIPGSVRLAF